MTPSTSASPTPSGKATESPASDTEAESRMFEALKITPPSTTLPMPPHSACARSSRKGRPSVPMLPIVKPRRMAKSTMPIT
jgi:hypothetical protein